MTSPRLATLARRLLLALPALAGALLAPAGPAEAAPAFGEVTVFAGVPAVNGFPEGIAVRGNRFYVAGPATFGTSANNEPSRVFEYDLKTGKLLRTLKTEGETVLGAEHANSCLAFDGAGQLYVLNTQLGTYRLDLATAQQRSYSTPFPDDGNCLLDLDGTGCTPTPANLPALPNDLVFDDAGNLYVTDSMQATIWRVPRGGGAPQAWFRDWRLASPYIGVNGLRLSPDRTKLFLSVTTDLMGMGRIYTLPLKANPTAADLAVFHTYAPGDGPDGIAFGKSGKLYVTMALPGRSGISILDAQGNETARLGNPPLSPITPYDSPANLAFDGKGYVLVTNHAFATGLALPDQFSVLKVYVGDTASPLVTPFVP